MGYIQPDSQGDHRSIDDSNTLARVEHALPAHRRIEQPRDRLPGHPPRWMAVESSRQPRSPFTLARGLRTLRHRDAGRVTFSFGSRTDPSRQATKRPIEVGRRSRPSPCARTRPTNAAELASHDRNRGPLRRRYRTEVWHRCRASSRMARDPRVASRCQPTDVEARDDHPLRHPPR